MALTIIFMMAYSTSGAAIIHFIIHLTIVLVMITVAIVVFVFLLPCHLIFRHEFPKVEEWLFWKSKLLGGPWRKVDSFFDDHWDDLNDYFHRKPATPPAGGAWLYMQYQMSHAGRRQLCDPFVCTFLSIVFPCNSESLSRCLWLSRRRRFSFFHRISTGSNAQTRKRISFA